MNRSVITANALEDWRREGREIRIPRDALLTPSARDWIRHAACPIAWLDVRADGDGATLGVAGGLSLPSLRCLHTELERTAGDVRVFETEGNRRKLIRALGRMCSAIQRGELTRGLVLVEDGAVSACVANKYRGIRACMGTGVIATDAAIRELGVNVLIIEYPQRTFHEMRQMIRRLVSGPGRTDKAVSQAIATAEASEG